MIAQELKANLMPVVKILGGGSYEPAKPITLFNGCSFSCNLDSATSEPISLDVYDRGELIETVPLIKTPS